LRKNSRAAKNQTKDRPRKPDSRKDGPTNVGSELRIIPIPVAGEITFRNSIADKVLDSLRQLNLTFESGDILVVKHKIVSKAEGQIVDLASVKPSARSIAWARKYKVDARVIELALRESRAVIRRKSGVLITETHHGFICANSGVDVSNVDGGQHALLLPADPDRSARELHRELKTRTGLSIPVLITDTFGRPWREGLVDFCIGIAGMEAHRDDRGHRDPHGYMLQASREAVADELASAAGLVCGKLHRTPACIIRGFPYETARGRSRDLLRPPANDLFR
jgi:coenzyme F420-0:L-glutamate ligase/coenzyme F420-1:gamma-L-glutamate ligase